MHLTCLLYSLLQFNETVFPIVDSYRVCTRKKMVLVLSVKSAMRQIENKFLFKKNLIKVRLL